ncbi:inositol polyphosphate kinase [Cystoisospora suis]|uniref:Kinase n=1 Tax=Cystoisospora suis TaxID=483139 RepID=A0A2C6L4V4_9APIC|nr:inositol polyphosphate kinase [Cystoisospora suis]
MVVGAADMTEHRTCVQISVSDAGAFATRGIVGVPLAGGHAQNFSFSADHSSVTKTCSLHEAGFYIWLHQAATRGGEEGLPCVVYTPAGRPEKNFHGTDCCVDAAVLTQQENVEGGGRHLQKHTSNLLQLLRSRKKPTETTSAQLSRSDPSSVFFERAALLSHFLPGEWWPVSPDACFQTRQILPWVPGFLGLEITGVDAECIDASVEESHARGQVTAVRLVNILRGMRRPVILDLKLGTRTYGDDASPEKRARATRYAEERGSLRLGLAFSGLSALEEDGKVFSVQGGSRAPAGYQYPKTIDDYIKVMRTFLGFAGPRERQYKLAREFLLKAEELSKTLVRLTVVNLYGSSVFLGYDAASDKQTFGTSTEKRDLAASAQLKIIDFAHVSVLPRAPDPGFCLGMGSLKSVLERTITELEREELPASAY